MEKNECKEEKTLLIITSSGGGGLIQAAIAKEQEAKIQHPDMKVIVKDLLREWIGKSMGIFAVFAYNWTQKKGNILLQTLLVNCQRAAEVLFLPSIFFRFLRILFSENIDRVIDTQPLGTKAIIRALRYYHKKRGTKIILEKIAVDLPTASCQHFFRGIKSLSQKDREYISFITLEPLLEENETEEAFWQKHCGLSSSQVVYEKYPIRQSFKKLMKKESPSSIAEILVRTSSQAEGEAQKRVFERGNLEFLRTFEGHLFKLSIQDRVMVILLGSNPAERAAFGYVEKTLQIVTKTAFSQPIYLFVFAGSYEKSLFCQIADFVKKFEPYPENVVVIPMSFQKDDVIAPLLFRSNLSITKSGGHTAMELMGVAQGKVWIHSEAKKKDSSPWTLNELLKGIASWEAGNAHYLTKKIGAEIVTPERFSSLFENLLVRGFID